MKVIMTQGKTTLAVYPNPLIDGIVNIFVQLSICKFLEVIIESLQQPYIFCDDFTLCR